MYVFFCLTVLPSLNKDTILSYPYYGIIHFPQVYCALKDLKESQPIRQIPLDTKLIIDLLSLSPIINLVE